MGLGLLRETLKDLRESKGLSLVQVSNETGISLATLHRYEGGREIIHAHRIRELADYYGVSYVDLMVLAGYLTEEKAGVCWSDAYKNIFRKMVH